MTQPVRAPAAIKVREHSSAFLARQPRSTTALFADLFTLASAQTLHASVALFCRRPSLGLRVATTSFPRAPLSPRAPCDPLLIDRGSLAPTGSGRSPTTKQHAAPAMRFRTLLWAADGTRRRCNWRFALSPPKLLNLDRATDSSGSDMRCGHTSAITSIAHHHSCSGNRANLTVAHANNYGELRRPRARRYSHSAVVIRE
jgi:hypothetical protein